MIDRVSDPLSRQRRVKLLGAIDQLVRRYEATFDQPALPKVREWIKAKLEEEKDKAIKDSLAHLEVLELIEVGSLIEVLLSPPPEEVRLASEITKVLEPDKTTDTPKKKRRGKTKKNS